MSQWCNTSFRGSFMAGTLGGGLVTGAILAVLVASGGFGASRRAVTVQETPIVPTTASGHAGGLTVHEITNGMLLVW
jgi:hypothetical protein